VTRVELAPQAGDDFERILDHLMTHEVKEAASRVGDIITAISALERNPLIGRPAQNERLELVIGRGSRGYVALYRYVPEIDTVFVLAVRNWQFA
jgi:plasmid stabilization system protein ParE